MIKNNEPPHGIVHAGFRRDSFAVIYRDFAPTKKNYNPARAPLAHLQFSKWGRHELFRS
jgi:hypothetical protein